MTKKTSMMINPEVRKKIKILAAIENLNMGNFIEKIVNEYEKKNELEKKDNEKENIKNIFDKNSEEDKAVKIIKEAISYFTEEKKIIIDKYKKVDGKFYNVICIPANDKNFNKIHEDYRKDLFFTEWVIFSYAVTIRMNGKTTRCIILDNEKVNKYLF